MSLGKVFANIKSILAKNKFVFSLILLAIFFRFYNFYDTVTFLGDQGRDAIIVKRIVTLEHLPLIGPSSSLGQIYLGPFYYYLISPFLLFFQFNPVGLAYGVALLSSLGLIAAYILLRSELKEKIALLFLILASFSYSGIYLSRFSWNPNLLPVFSFFVIYFLYKFLCKKNFFYAILAGAFLSFSIQLHYLAALILPTVLFFLLKYLTQTKKNFPFKQTFLFFFSFIFFTFPLLLFELRHDFLNTRSISKLFGQNNFVGQTSFISGFIETSKAFFSFVFQIPVSSEITIFFLILILVYFIRQKLFEKNLFLQVNFINFFFSILFFSFLNTFRHIHYYGPTYYSFYIILSVILLGLFKKKFIFKAVILIFLASYVFLNLKNYGFIFKKNVNQIKKAQRIAESIIEKKPLLPFQVVALPFTETDGHIRYFLEIKGYTPLPADTVGEPKELYVLCPQDCQVLGNAQWQIAAFKKAKIDKIWNSEGIKIFKLIHAR